MNRHEIKGSSQIKAIGYKPSKMLLEVEFHNGGVYQYHPVTEEAHLELLKAASVGKYFNANIKGNDSIKYKEM